MHAQISSYTPPDSSETKKKRKEKKNSRYEKTDRRKNGLHFLERKKKVRGADDDISLAGKRLVNERPSANLYTL